MEHDMSNSYALTPRQITDDHWSVTDAAGEEKAYAIRDELSGVWTAYLNPKLCAECMNFLSFRADDPESALAGLINCNLRVARDIVSELEGIDAFMVLRVFDEVEVEDKEDILAAV